MSGRTLGVATGSFPRRAYSFVRCLDGSKVFLAADDWLEPLTNRMLIAFDVEQEAKGPRARDARKATFAEAEHSYRVGFVMDFNPTTEVGHVVDGGANYWRFSIADLDESITTLFEGDEILLVPDVSERKTRFALSIRKPKDVVTAQQIAA